MFLILCVIILLVSVPLTGGDPRRLAGLRLRSAELLFVALALQILICNVWPTMPRAAADTLHLLSYVLAAVVIWRNRKLPGVPLFSLGAALNGFVIALNHGTLPASASALRRAGMRVDPGDFTNSGVLQHPHLRYFGDVFATPSWMPWHNVFSIGDVLIIAGAAILLHASCNTKLAGLVGRLRPRALRSASASA